MFIIYSLQFLLGVIGLLFIVLVISKLNHMRLQNSYISTPIKRKVIVKKEKVKILKTKSVPKFIAPNRYKVLNIN